MRHSPSKRLASLSPWYGLAVAVVVGYVVVLLLSAALAPPLTQPAAEPTPATNDTADGLLASNATVVGAQGSFSEADGTIAVVRQNGSIAWTPGGNDTTFFDVEPLDDHRLLASFLTRDASSCGPYAPPCARTGFRVYNVSQADPLVREWTYPVWHYLNRESHDADVLPNGNVVVVGMDQERIFVVNRTGDIVWEWRASQFYEAPADPADRDWLHMNDVDRIAPGRFLVSVRNANQLLVIERGRGVVEVVNADTDDDNDASCRQDGQLVEGDDGDVRCGDPTVFEHQHNPQWLASDRILVADSDNDRVVLVERTNGTWDTTWALDAAGGIPFRWPRDVDLIDNDTLLVTDSLNDRVLAVRWNGSVVWSVSPAAIPYEADRLPGGEYSTSQASENRSAPGEIPGGAPQADDGSVPVLTPVYRAVKGALLLPHWFSQWHLVGFGVTVVTAVGALVGGYVRGSRE